MGISCLKLRQDNLLRSVPYIPFQFGHLKGNESLVSGEFVKTDTLSEIVLGAKKQTGSHKNCHPWREWLNNYQADLCP